MKLDIYPKYNIDKMKVILPNRRFNAREEMDIAVKILKLTMLIPSTLESPIEKVKLAAQKEQRDRTLAEIDLVQQGYIERLEAARKAGTIGDEEYNAARLAVLDPFNPFERMRLQVRGYYKEAVKFCL